MSESYDRDGGGEWINMILVMVGITYEQEKENERGSGTLVCRHNLGRQNLVSPHFSFDTFCAARLFEVLRHHAARGQ